MDENTQYIKIEDGPDQGLWCSYCGKKVIPKHNNDGIWIFSCTCKHAITEANLKKACKTAAENLDQFYATLKDLVRYTELTLRIIASENQITEWKKEKEELEKRYTPEEEVLPHESTHN